MKLADFLALLRSGMLAADYRTVPASVDVVTVKSYDLVEPHSNKFVFALGMTSLIFPKIVQNKSLISDEERAKSMKQLLTIVVLILSLRKISRKIISPPCHSSMRPLRNWS